MNSEINQTSFSKMDTPPPPKSTKSKLLALLEVIVIRFFVYGGLAYGVLYLWEHVWLQDPQNWLVLQFLIGALWFLVPLLIINLHQKQYKKFGIQPHNVAFSVNLGMNAFVVLLIVNAGYLILMFFALDYSTSAGSLILTACFCVALLMLFSGKKSEAQEQQEAASKLRSNLVLIPLLLALPLIIGAITGKMTPALVLTVVWQFIFSGFGEECFFRGYIQSRLNDAFGRPYRFRNIDFGPGLIITAALFALSHILNTYSIFTGEGYLSWWWGLFTFVGGLVFGLLREKSKDIYASGIAHGMEAIGEGFALLF